MKLPLSVLDLSPVGTGVAPSEAIRESMELVRIADRLGYTRYWFAEHHNMASIAASAPEVLIAHAAAVTTRIRVGAGGIMVPNHAPLHVVEVFRTLEALHPGRIDLGLGRAPGTDPLTSQALRREAADVNRLLGELLAFERGQFPEHHPFVQITPMPSDVRLSSIWMLGSTVTGAAIAAKLGVPFAFAGHFTMTHAKEAMSHYRRHFEPSPQLATPYAMLAVTVVCGVDDADADRLAAPIRVAVVNNRTGKRAPIPSIEEALRHRFSPAEQAILDEFFAGAAIGGPATVAERLRSLARDCDPSELMLSTLVPGLAGRIASLERTMAAMR